MGNYGSRIKKARETAGLTQEQLGEQIGVTGVTIMRYEKDLREPRQKQLQAIATALGVPVEYFHDFSSQAYLDNTFTKINSLKKQLSEATSEEEREELESALFVLEESYTDLCFAQALSQPQRQAQRESIIQRDLITQFDKLNAKGQQVAVERVEELTKIPDYQKDKNPADSD